jgi:hypothetical protein
MDDQEGSQKRAPFAALASSIDTPEQLGVVLLRSVLDSAVRNKITTADGRNVIVPIAISIQPLPQERAAETTRCHSECWKVLGHDVVCRRVCTKTLETEEQRHKILSDERLRARVKSGPPLVDSDKFDDVVKRTMLSAATPGEVGIVMANKVAGMLADGTANINDDGSADLEAVALISTREHDVSTTEDGARGVVVTRSICTQVTIQILGIDVLTHETCEEFVAQAG